MERQAVIPTGSVRRVRRRAIAILLVAAAFIGSVTYWLASTGGSTSSIAPPAGTPSSGSIADVATMSSNVTSTNGAAQLQTGVALAKLTMSKTVTNHIRVEVSWTNAVQGARVLNNPNVQISIGIYHTIHTGNCNSASNSVDAPLVNLTDTNADTYCAALDESATGKFANSSGKLLLAQNQVAGYLKPSIDGSGSLSACASSGSDTNTWCQPASVSDSNQRALYVIASIVTPGGIPQGQQPNLSSLTFYTQVMPTG